MDITLFNYIEKYAEFINSKTCIISKQDFMKLAYKSWTIENPNYLEFDNICWSSVEHDLNAHVLVRLHTEDITIQFKKCFTKYDMVNS